jgi:hypothetical protein
VVPTASPHARPSSAPMARSRLVSVMVCSPPVVDHVVDEPPQLSEGV